MTGNVLQLNISKGGVPKLPIAEATVNRLGIEGDGHAHPMIHGGPDKALLLIASEVIDELTAAGYPVYPGALGENVTMRGIDRRQIRLRQRYRIGEVIVEITRSRRPCEALNVYGPGIQAAIFDTRVKTGDVSSPRWGMSGFYTMVLSPGIIRPGDPIVLLEESA